MQFVSAVFTQVWTVADVNGDGKIDSTELEGLRLCGDVVAVPRIIRVCRAANLSVFA